MPAHSTADPVLVEISTLRQELAELRREQQEMRQVLEDLTRTFRAIAVQIGIAAEPYRKSGAEPEKARDLPGFA